MLKYYLHKTINNKDYKEIISKGGFFLIIRVFGLMAGYIYTFLITKRYGAETYGLLSLAFSLFFFFGIIGRMGVDINVAKFYSIEENEKDFGLFYIVLFKSFIISSLIALLLYFSSDFFVYKIFHKPQLKPFISWISLSIPFWSVTLICGGILRAKKNNAWFAFFDNPGRFIFSIIAFLILVLITDKPIISAVSHSIGIIVIAIVSFIVVFIDIKTITLKTMQSSWVFFKDAFPMMLSSTILILMGWADTFILGIFESGEHIGIYNVAVKISSLTGLSLMAINSILAPKIAQFYSKGETERLNEIIRFSASVNFYITLLIVLSIIVFHNWLLGLFGHAFLNGKTALIVLCIGQIFNSLAGSVGIILQMTGYQKIFQNTLLLALFINLALNFMLIPHFGIMGAAFATVFSMIFWNITGAFYLNFKLNIISYYRFFKK